MPEVRRPIGRPAQLTRKVYILHDVAAFACSGDESSIVEFLETANALILQYQQEDRPMLALSKLAGFRQKVLGATVIHRDEADPTTHELMPCRSRSDSRPDYFVSAKFGRVAALGSGAEELKRDALLFEASINATDPRRAAVELCTSLNGMRLAQDLYQRSPHRDGWGGYLECCYYDPFKKRWARAPRVLHLFYFLVDEAGDGLHSAKLGRMAIAYDPGGDHARVLSISVNLDGSLSRNEWVLRDVLKGSNPESNRTLEFWLNWQPVIYGITFIHTTPPKGVTRANIIRYVGDDFRPAFQAFPNCIFGLTDEFLFPIAAQVCEQMGIEFRSTPLGSKLGA